MLMEEYMTVKACREWD